MFKQPFTEASLRAAIQIMDDLSQSPCAKEFLLPVDPDHVPNYYQIITEPIYLYLISENLLLHKYQTIDQWITDVYRIKNNARKFNGDRSFIYSLAVVLCKKFEKHLQEFYKFDHKIWIQVYSLISRKLQKQMKQIPTKLTVSSSSHAYQIHNFDFESDFEVGQKSLSHSIIETKSSIENSSAFSDGKFNYGFKKTKSEKPKSSSADSSFVPPESTISKPKKVPKKDKPIEKVPIKESKPRNQPSFVHESQNVNQQWPLPPSINQNPKPQQNFNPISSVNSEDWQFDTLKLVNQNMAPSKQPDYFANAKTTQIREQWPDTSFLMPNPINRDSSLLASNQKPSYSSTKSQPQQLQMPQNPVSSTPPKSIFDFSAETKSIFNSSSNGFNLPSPFPTSPTAQEKSLFANVDIEHLPKELPPSDPLSQSQSSFGGSDSFVIGQQREQKKTQITLQPPSAHTGQLRQQPESATQSIQKPKQSKKSQQNKIQMTPMHQQQMPAQQRPPRGGTRNAIPMTTTPQPSIHPQVQLPPQPLRNKQKPPSQPPMAIQSTSQKKSKGSKAQGLKQGAQNSIVNSPTQSSYPSSMRQMQPNGPSQRQQTVSQPNGIMMGQPMQYSSMPQQNDVLSFQPQYPLMPQGPSSQFVSMPMQSNAQQYRMNMYDRNPMNFPISSPEMPGQINDLSKQSSQNDHFNIWPQVQATSSSAGIGFPQQLTRNQMNNMRQMPGQAPFGPQQSMPANMVMSNPMNPYILP